MAASEDDNPLFLKQLDHVQAVIERLAGNSFLLKGWAVTLVSALVALSIKDGKSAAYLSAVGIIPAVVFWLLDAYYLATERRLRSAYLAALSSRELSFDVSNPSMDKIVSAAFSWITSAVYLTLATIALLAMLLQ